MTKADSTFSDDVLRGADSIAEYLFGSPKKRRKVYHMASDAKKSRLPVFHMGAVLCARKSKIIQWIEEQEEGRKSA